MPARRSVALVFAALFSLPAIAHADLVVPPPPECVDRPDGTRCILDNGTAGLCAHHQDPRRPGRVNITCEADAHECDSLPAGAECHGYLRRPSHCRSFTNDRNEHWTACMNDDTTSVVPADPPANANPSPAPRPNNNNGNTVVAPTTPPASTGRRCDVSPGHVASDASALATLGALGIATLAFAGLRRRRRATR